MKLHVHVGVHKTATTYLQGLLAKNRGHLNHAGFGVMPLNQFRLFFTRNLMTFPAGKFRIEDHLDKFFAQGAPPDLRGLILSDENLIGLCNGLIVSGKAYQAADRRLSHLRKLLAGHEVTLYMSIRSYSAFASSAYCEVMRHVQQFSSFASFHEKLDIEALRWPAMIDRFAAALAPAEIKLWRLEDFRDNSDAVFRDLAFGAEAAEGSAESNGERPSFSQAAVSVLETLSARLGAKVAAELVGAMSESLPKGFGKGEYPAFDPWSADEQREMAALYEWDCAAIPAEYWLIPPA